MNSDTNTNFKGVGFNLSSFYAVHCYPVIVNVSQLTDPHLMNSTACLRDMREAKQAKVRCELKEERS